MMLKGAVFHIVFTDAHELPPPYRIDNMSEVPILFYQSRTEDYQRGLLQPKQSGLYKLITKLITLVFSQDMFASPPPRSNYHSYNLFLVPYAWDEPTLKRELTCGIVNDGSFIHFSLDKLGEKDKLYYYNAIYIAFTHTLNK